MAAVTLWVLLLLVTRPSLAEDQAQETRLVLLTDEYDNVTSLVVQMAVELPLLQGQLDGPALVSGHGGPQETSTKQPHINIRVEELPWSAVSNPFRMATLVSEAFTGNTLMVVAKTSNCDRAGLVEVASGWNCVPLVVAPPWWCGMTAVEGKLLPVSGILVVTLDKVIETLREQGAEIGEVGKIILIVDKITKPLVIQDSFLYSVDVIEADAMYDVTSSVYNDILDHRGVYRMFVVLVTSSNFQIFPVARDLELLSAVQTWVVLSLDTAPSAFTRFTRPGDNMVIIDLRRRFQQRQINPLLQPLLSDVSPLLQDLYDMVVITTAAILHRLNTTSNINLKNCASQITTQDLENKLRAMTSLRVWMTSERSSSLVFVGFMNPYSTASLHFQLIRPFRGFHGRVFNITTLPNAMFQVQQPDGSFRGLAFDLLDAMADHLNFSYRIIKPPDGKWGGRRADGSWMGMIGMVKNREVDFAVGSFTITSSREAVIDFTFPYWEGAAGMIMRTSSNQGRLFVHLRPFSLLVWACAFGSMLVCACVLWTFSGLSAQVTCVEGRRGAGLARGRSDTDGWFRRVDRNTPGWSSVLLMSFGLQWHQSPSWIPVHGPARAALGMVWLVFMVLGATYTGNLTAYLAVPRVTVPADSLSELAAQIEYNVGLVNGQALMDVFKNAQDDTVYSVIWDKISQDSDNIVRNLHVGRQRLMSTGYIYLDDIKNLVAIQEEEANKGDCSLYIAKQKFYFSGYAFPLQTNAPYMHIFNQEILNVLSSGLTEKWMKQYWPDTDGKCGKSKTVVHAIHTTDVMGLFYLLILGITASIIIFSGEYILQKCKKTTKKKP